MALRIASLLLPRARGLLPSPGQAHNCCVGQTVRLGLFEGQLQPYWNFDGEMYSGYLPEVFKLIAYDMGFTPEIVKSSLQPGKPPSNISWFSEHGADMIVLLGFEQALVHPVFQQAVVTSTVFDGFIGAAVLQTRADPGPLVLFDPFDGQMWAAVCASVVIAALLLVIFNILSPSEEFEEMPLKERLSTAYVMLSNYHMVAALLSGEDYEWTTWPGRVLRLALLFLVLVTTTSYTANLAAFFNKPSFVIHGPEDMVGLRKAKACVSFPDHDPMVSAFTKSVEYMPEFNYADPNILEKSTAYCINLLREQKVDAWMRDIGGLRPVVEENCDELVLREKISVTKITFAFMLPDTPELHKLATQLTATITHLKGDPVWSQLQGDYFREGRDLCGEKVVSALEPITLYRQRGLFYICGVLAGIALVIALVHAARKRLSGESKKDERQQHTMTDGELLRLLIKQVNRIGQKLHVAGGGTKASAFAAYSSGETRDWESLRVTDANEDGAVPALEQVLPGQAAHGH